MPSSSDELREIMVNRFGDIDITGPLQYLINKGWTEKAGLLSKNGGAFNCPQDEWECAVFLFEEWDFALDREDRE